MGRSSEQTRADVYISVDIEADGPIPGLYSMISIGAAVAGYFSGKTFLRADATQHTFYRELKPISDEFVAESLAVSGLDRDWLKTNGVDPAVAMTEFTAWVRSISDNAKPVMVGYPANFDWMFMHWYIVRFSSERPFGHSSCLDMKSMYAIKAEVPYSHAIKHAMPKELLSQRRHTHNALDDAIEQAELFANLFMWKRTEIPF